MKRKKQLLYLLVIIICSISCISMASAEETFNFNSSAIQTICANLTDNDDVEDAGTIDTFIYKVKNGLYTMYDAGEGNHQAKALFSIIPQKLFENPGEYSFQGKEYSFYINRTETQYYDGFLVDYDFIHNSEYGTIDMKVNFLSFKCFLYEYDGEPTIIGANVYVTEQFYITNPECMGAIYNANDYNDFDNNYSKHNDEGAIIEQVNFFYNGSYDDTETSLDSIADYSVKLAVSGAAALIQNPCLNLAIDINSDLYEFMNVLMDSVQYETITYSKEDSSCYNKIRSAQIADENQEYFTRMFHLKDFSSRVFLDDYYQVKIRLSEETSPILTTFTSRFQVWSRMTENEMINPLYKNDPEKANYFFVSLNKMMYEKIYDYSETEENNIYALNSGRHIYKYNAPLSGKYLIQNNSDCEVNVYSDIDADTLTLNNLVEAENGAYSFSAYNDYYIEFRNNNTSESIEDTSSLTGNFVIAPIATESYIGINVLETDRIYKITDNMEYDYAISVANGDIYVYSTQIGFTRYDPNEIIGRKYANEDLYFKIESSANDYLISRSKNIEYVSLNEVVYTQIYTDGNALYMPTREHYNFSGWYEEPDFSGEQITYQNIWQETGAEVTLYAKWTPINYNITYYTNGGTTLNNDVYTIEDNIVLNAEVQKQGYVFVGWYDNEDFEGAPVEELPIGTFGNKNYYARWAVANPVISQYVINYEDVNNQEVNFTPFNISINYAQTYTLPTPSTVGYVFLGWYYNDVQLTDGLGQAIAPYLFYDAVSVTARWGISQIQFQLTNSEGAVRWLVDDSQLYTIAQSMVYDGDFNINLLSPNDLINVLLNNPTTKQAVSEFLYRDGYQFSHLSYDENGYVDADASIWSNLNNTVGNTEFEISVYPQYKKETYDLYFINNNEVVHSLRLDYGDIITYPNINLVVDGVEYTVTTWAKTAQNGLILDDLVQFSYTYMPDITKNEEGSGSVILKAFKKYVNYNIEYIFPSKTISGHDVDTSLLSFDPIDSYTYVNSFSLPIVQSDRFVFEGWYSDQQYNNKITEINYGCTGDLILYAKFTTVRHLVTFDANGGTECDSIYVQHNTTFTFPVSIKERNEGAWNMLVFDGIGYVGDFGQQSPVIKSDRTFVAQWEPYCLIFYQIKTLSNSAIEEFKNQ